MRKQIVAMILATDLQIHFEKLSAARNMLETEGLDITQNSLHKIKALEILIKCADIGHATKAPMIHKLWSCLITKEFFNQGD
jgi:cAMP-specific phosphodiesterase 4